MRAAESDVVVVNTHLYGAHLASGGAVLPPHDIVVFDEAHEVDEVMTASLGVDVTPGRLAALHAVARSFVQPDDASSVDLAYVAERLRGTLAGRTGQRIPDDRATRSAAGTARGSGSRRPEPEVRERPFFALPGPSPPPASSFAGAADELSEVLALATARVERLRAVLGRATTQSPTDSSVDGARRARALTAAANLGEDLRRLGAPGPDEVVWVDGTPRHPVLRLSPIDVGPALSTRLWGSVTAVLTSATVPPRLTEQLGMEGFDHDSLDVGSPFDYATQALLYVARHLPDRRHPAAEPALHEELSALIDAAGGRTLALFTSRRATVAAAEALRDRLPYTVLVQGDLPKGRLLEAFAAEESSCLFATIGFWQGVDVPGRALSMVTLDRLPFGRPDDPLLDARRERAGDAAFFLVDLPRAATLLAQGVGRLIRTATDRGVVAVLDPRLATAGYRRVLLDALPPMRRTVERDEVAEFLARVLADAQ
jgi:ATP-dependent DNA helicase DinG